MPKVATRRCVATFFGIILAAALSPLASAARIDIN
jgi:hypothetical protein